MNVEKFLLLITLTIFLKLGWHEIVESFEVKIRCPFYTPPPNLTF